MKRVDVGPAMRRCVLAALLVDVNRPVQVDHLVDRVWGERPPLRARNTLFSYLTRLRQLSVPIERRSGGYVLTAEAETVDLHRFRRLVAEAGSDGAQLEEALRLWRGEPFAGLDTPWINGVRDALLGEYRAAEQDWTDAKLRAGGHATVLAGLVRKADDAPLDERLAGQLMLAQYQSGRQADALETYRRTRERLSEELGVDPSRQLQDLHQQILAGEPVQLTKPVVPRQLPVAPAAFVGRATELKNLDTATIAVVCGAGGMGKTWLVLRWAHDHVDDFPDGQLHVNLHGFAPNEEPLHPTTVLHGFLRALGVQDVPPELDARISLYRSMTAGRRMLVVLDNARDSAQVEPLLPGGQTCKVLVSSRNRMAALATTHGAWTLSLSVLSDDEARDVLAGHLGRAEVAAEPEALQAVLDHCAGLPLALGIVTARAVTHPGLAALADELVEARLDALDAGELPVNLRAVFDASLRALTKSAANLFALLGAAPGPDISRAAALRLDGDAPRPLRELENAHLVRQVGPDRYRMHDLIRIYAAELPHDTNVIRGLVGYYAQTAERAEQLADGRLRPEAQELADETTALTWLAAEDECLKAAQLTAFQHGWDREAVLLTSAIDVLHRRRGWLDPRIGCWRTGLAAAVRLDEPWALITAHRGLGFALALCGEHVEAVRHLEHSLALATETFDEYEQARTHQALADTWRKRGDLPRAVRDATSALELCRKLGIPAVTGQTLYALGCLLAIVGRHEEALAYGEESLSFACARGDRIGEAHARRSVACVAKLTGRHAVAVKQTRWALELFRELGNGYLEADVLVELGDAYVATGQVSEARHSWQEALRVLRHQHRRTTVRSVEGKLDHLGRNQ